MTNVHLYPDIHMEKAEDPTFCWKLMMLFMNYVNIMGCH